MSDPNTIIRLHLTGEGMNLEELGWPDLREFLDLIVDAIGAQPGGPKPNQVLPLAVKAGSAEPRLRVPRSAVGAVDRFRRGWNKNWTVEQRRSARPVYDFLEKRGARLETGVRKLQPLVLPKSLTDWEVVSMSSLQGEVTRAGGKQGNVEINFDRDGWVVCQAGRERARILGKHLYERVEVIGEARRDSVTGKLLRFRIDDQRFLDPLRPGSILDWARELNEELGDSLSAFDDPEEFMRRCRG